MSFHSTRTVASGVLLAVLASAGCAATFTKKDKLGDVVYPFYDAWRWKKVPSLASRVAPETRQEFVAGYTQSNDDVLYADYEVTEISILEDGLTAHVSVVFQWYRQSDPRLVEAQVLETWRREGKGKPWFWTDQEVIVGAMP